MPVTATQYNQPYAAKVPMSSITPFPTLMGAPAPNSIYQGYVGLATAADKERQAMMQREAERQNAVIGGYNQQLSKSSAAGQQAYNQLAADYGALTADAAATRDRNMGRIDQYGNSMRQDLDIQNQQRLAAARQSAIQRGLGNTTIQDSLVRGQNFDNTRQRLALEDQLLQNRIATDSQLSGAYQSALQNRAQGLNTQWNRNIDNDNRLAGEKLGYIGNIREDMQGFDSVANLYTQLLQMQNSNAQAEASRNQSRPQPGYVIGRLGRARGKW